MTLGVDLGYIRTLLAHGAAVHGLPYSSEPVDLAGTRCVCRASSARAKSEIDARRQATREATIYKHRQWASV